MKDSKIIDMDNMLDAKEKRYYKIKDLTEKFGLPVLSFMLNIPGEDKNFKDAVNFHKDYIKEIKKTFDDNEIKIIYEEYHNLNTGMEYLAVFNGNGKFVKEKMIDLEEKDLGGRLLDIDIYDSDFSQISRSVLNLPERRCILCTGIARTCIKEERHSLNDLKEKVRRILKNYKMEN